MDNLIPEIYAKKIAYDYIASAELMAAWSLGRKITDEERAANRAHFEARRAERAAYREAWLVVLTYEDDTLRRVAELHRPVPYSERVPDSFQCHGCDADGFEWEYPSWPCRTAELIGEIIGKITRAD